MEKVKKIINIVLAGCNVGQKLNYMKYLFSKRRKVLNYEPVVISIVATGRCTLSCDMCPTHSRYVPKDYSYRQRNEKDIDFAMFKEIIDRFKKALEVHIIGSGEPLLNKDFFRMVDYASGKKMLVKTFSNGTTIEGNIDGIITSRLDGITVSLNGHNPREFERMTGMEAGIYKNICDSVKLLIAQRDKRQSKLKVKLSFIVDRQNYHFIPEMINLGLDLKANHIFFCNFLPSPYSGLRFQERALLFDQAVIAEINRGLRDYPKAIRKRITLPRLVDTNAGTNSCGVHFSQIRFDGDGNISSCSMMLLNMQNQGNYRDDNPWNNEFFMKMRELFLSGSNEYLPEPCKVCPENKGITISTNK
jgi:radical SAM protein with 4Fe4S-binding SPASM domain